jgi:hypothetical protein
MCLRVSHFSCVDEKVFDCVPDLLAGRGCENAQIRLVRGQETEVLHSRTIEKRMAAAKQAKIMRWFSIALLSPEDRRSDAKLRIEN